MKFSMKNQSDNTFNKLQGTAQQIVGKLRTNQKLETEGPAATIAEKVQGKIEQFKKILGRD